MKKRFLFVFLFVILSLFIVANKISQACDYIPHGITINAKINKDIISDDRSCLDENCLYVLSLSKNEWGFDNYIISKTKVELNDKLIEIDFATVDINNNIIKINQYYNLILSENNEDLLEALSNLIKDDISAIKPRFLKEIELWKSEKNKLSNLFFKPYSKSEEERYNSTNNQLFNCRQVNYKRVDDWLISYYKVPDYCYFVSSTTFSCPEINISFFKLFFYSLTNINKITLVFLISFLTLISLLTFLFIYLIKKKDLVFFLKPRLIKIISLIIFYIIIYLISPFIFLIYLSFLNPIYGLYSFIAGYLAISLIDYIIRKKIK